MPLADQVSWISPRSREFHFRKHGAAMGYATVEAYDRSAHGTVRAGRRFTYRERGGLLKRVGYYHRQTGRLTVLDESKTRIVNHFECSEGYVRRQIDSNYTR